MYTSFITKNTFLEINRGLNSISYFFACLGHDFSMFSDTFWFIIEKVVSLISHNEAYNLCDKLRNS